MTIPVHADPDWKRSATQEEIAQLADESGCPPKDDPAAAGWDIDYWFQLRYGRNPNGDLTVRANPAKACQRTVTPAQLADHARHLLMLVEDEARRGTDAGKGISVDVQYGLLNAPFGVEQWSSEQAVRAHLADADAGKIVTRAVITWSDGTIHVSAWAPVDGVE